MHSLSLTLNSHTVTPPSQSPDLDLGLLRQQAILVMHHAIEQDPDGWSDLVPTLTGACWAFLMLHHDAQSDFWSTRLQNDINCFLFKVKHMQHTLETSYPHLQSVSFALESCSNAVIDALSQLQDSKQALTPSKELSYVLLCLPANNSSPDQSSDNSELKEHFAQQLCWKCFSKSCACFL